MSGPIRFLFMSKVYFSLLWLKFVFVSASNSWFMMPPVFFIEILCFFFSGIPESLLFLDFSEITLKSCDIKRYFEHLKCEWRRRAR